MSLISFKRWLQAGLLTCLAAAVSLAATPQKAPSARVNVLLITIDTLRADHLGCYGYKDIQTPNIDRLAAEGVRFAQAFSNVPITLPSHTVLFTGMTPMATGMHDFSGNSLNPNVPTLAAVLGAEGYETAGVTASAVLDTRFGLDHGFDFYYADWDFSRLAETNLDAMERPGNVVMDQALGWLKQHDQKPFFLWVHLYDPHHPYTPPPPYDAQYKTHPYDGEIAFDDAQVGRLLTYLEQRKLYDKTLIVLVGDHGEALGEHGEETHGFFVYTSTLHVPLIFKLPASQTVPRQVVDGPISLLDVMPTILQLAGSPIPGQVQGRSLFPLLLSHRREPAEGLYAETFLPRLHFDWSELRSIRLGDYHFIEAPKPELYDLSQDPDELHNLYAEKKDVAEGLRQKLTQLIAKYSPPEGTETAGTTGLDPALAERLKSLGYAAVSGRGGPAPGQTLADPKDRIQVYELFSDAMADSQHGRYPESSTKLRAALRVEPDSLPVHYLLGLNNYRMSDFEGALTEFEKALELKPDYSLAAFYLGLAYARAGKFRDAAAALQHALDLDGTNFSAAFNLGAAYLRLRQIDEAATAFQQAVTINPEFAPGYEALGEVLLYQGKVDEAVKALRRAVTLNPNSPKGHRVLAKALQAKGLHAEAQEELRKADALGPAPNR